LFMTQNVKIESNGLWWILWPKITANAS
jgi:hypothetical protein